MGNNLTRIHRRIVCFLICLFFESKTGTAVLSGGRRHKYRNAMLMIR